MSAADDVMDKADRLPLRDTEQNTMRSASRNVSAELSITVRIAVE